MLVSALKKTIDFAVSEHNSMLYSLFYLCNYRRWRKNMMSSKNWLKKIVIIIVGSVIAAYGITLALYAGFGGATLAVLWQGISETFHISIGMASFVVPRRRSRLLLRKTHPITEVMWKKRQRMILLATSFPTPMKTDRPPKLLMMRKPVRKPNHPCRGNRV